MKYFSRIYLLVTFLMFVYTILAIFDNRIGLKYDLSPEKLVSVPLKDSFRESKKHELFNLQVYGGYTILSFAFGVMVLYKFRKMKQETNEVDNLIRTNKKD